MDIILNTMFNNPALPVIDRPGFRDDFDRPSADTLGTTHNDRPWEPLVPSGNTSAVWGTRGDGTGGQKVSGGYHQLVVADAQASDGLLSAKFSGHDASHRRFGISARVIDVNNWVTASPNSPSWNTLRINQMVGGSFSTISSGVAPELAAGDVLSLALSGTQVSLLVNGEEFTSGTCDASLAGATRHGLYAFSGGVSWWDWIEFTT